MLNSIVSFYDDESGATAIEYGLIASLVSVAAIGAFNKLGVSIDGTFDDIGSSLSLAAEQIDDDD